MKVSMTLSAASNAKERNIVALKRYQETIDEEELSSSFASNLRRRMGSARPIGVSRLEEDLELSTTVNDSETSSAANQPMKGVTEKPTSNGDQSTTECALESSTGVGSSKRKPPSSSCVPQKRSKVSPLTPRSTEILLMSHSEAGPSNVSSQPPHFMDCITSTPHDPTENHKIAGGYLRLLHEVDKLFQSRFQKDAEGRLYRENHRISQYQEGYGMLVARFCEGSRLELKLMDEKVAALKRLIKRFNEELVMTVNAKRDLLDSHAMFSRHVSKVLADMPKSGLSDSEDESIDGHDKNIDSCITESNVANTDMACTQTSRPHDENIDSCITESNVANTDMACTQTSRPMVDGDQVDPANTSIIVLE